MGDVTVQVGSLVGKDKSISAVELRPTQRAAYVAGHAQWVEASGALLGDRFGAGCGRRDGHNWPRTNRRRSRGTVPVYWCDGLCVDFRRVASPDSGFKPASEPDTASFDADA